MRFRRRGPNVRAFLIGVWCASAAWCPCARAQVLAPAELPPPTPGSASVSALLPAPPTTDQIAERLRAMEELNARLSGQLEAATREHNEQMKQLRERYAELSRRLGGGAELGATA